MGRRKHAIAATLAAAVAATAPAAAEPWDAAGWPDLKEITLRNRQAAAAGRTLDACMWALMAAAREEALRGRYEAVALILAPDQREECRKKAFEWRPADDGGRGAIPRTAPV